MSTERIADKLCAAGYWFPSVRKSYLFLSVCALLSLAFCAMVTIAIPREYFLAMKLEDNPGQWSLVFKSDFSSQQLNKPKPEKELIAFIHRNRNNYGDLKVPIALSISALFFSLIGYFRERHCYKMYAMDKKSG